MEVTTVNNLLLDNGNTDQKIQYLIITGTQDLVDNSLLNFS